MDRKLFSLGLFVVVSLGLLVWLASQLGVIGTRAVDQYTVRLDNAAGLVPGNAIKSSGVEIGRISAVTLVRDEDTKRTMAKVDLHVRFGTPILSDAEVSVAPKSLLGEKFLDLEQGTHPGAKELPPGSQLPDGIKSVDVADIFDLARPLVESEEDLYPVVVELAKRLNHLVGALDPEDKADFKKSVSNISTKVNSILDNTDKLAENAVGMVNENREELNAILDRTRELVERPELDSILKRGNSVLFTLDTKLPKTIEKLDGILDKTDRLITRVDGKKVERILTDVETITTDAKVVSSDLRKLSKHLEPLVINLKILAKRAVNLKESWVRQFMQVEGVRVRMTGSGESEAKSKIKKLKAVGK